MSMAKIFGATLAVNVAEKVIVTIIDIIRDELESKQTAKTAQDMESKIKQDSKSLKKKTEDLLKNLETLEKSKQDEIQQLIQELEKQGMKNEKQTARALKTRWRKDVRQLSRRINTLQEDVEEWPETIMLDLQSRVELMNIKRRKKENIASALESMLKKKKQKFLREIEALKYDVEECMETIEDEIEILRDELKEKKQGNKKKSAWPLECCKETEVEPVFSPIQAMMVWKNAGL